MAEQNYKNHTQLVPAYHFVLMPVLLLTLIGSCVNLYDSIDDHLRLYSASLIVVLVVCVMGLTLFARLFALKAQDRAIRAEENLRHFVLAGRVLDSRLTVKQIVALRFAADGEFVALASRAANKGFSAKEIKQAIQHWRADTYRV